MNWEVAPFASKTHYKGYTSSGTEFTRCGQIARRGLVVIDPYAETWVEAPEKLHCRHCQKFHFSDIRKKMQSFGPADEPQSDHY